MCRASSLLALQPARTFARAFLNIALRPCCDKALRVPPFVLLADQ